MTESAISSRVSSNQRCGSTGLVPLKELFPSGANCISEFVKNINAILGGRTVADPRRSLCEVIEVVSAAVALLKSERSSSSSGTEMEIRRGGRVLGANKKRTGTRNEESKRRDNYR
ncbi:hypothetical protein HAX54_021179 [Datura stramonium]|uniref:Uncharacterized protein n=1 Tax=Datura stramonium TaxID=4076 RepID=A0ABS8UUN5_DATST|nr:hypothetical protein [Datura stramonium]